MEFAPVEAPVPGAPLRVLSETAQDELTELARALVASAGNWTFHVDTPWAYARPDGAPMPAQGWKLHVSATEASAEAVLSATAPVLLAERVPFKFAATRSLVRILNSATAARASGGKFLTVYPADDDQAVRVAEACHRATAGLAGPVILSDRPYRPGSLVHYRYGGFSDQHAIDADGMVVQLIRTPDGRHVPDERKAAYQAPPWAADPFRPPEPAPAAAAPPAGAGGPVLLNDRYLVRAALRHANKGGTYLAEDIAAGTHVVIKEGRPHVGGSDSGGDARDRVRHEGHMLELAGPLGVSPALIEVFEQGGHVFVVEEHIPAPTLRDMVAERTDPPEPGLPALEVAVLAALLASTMDSFHAAGIVLRDFNPNNVLAGPGHEMVVVDLELAHPLGERPGGGAAGTPGYASPEQLRGEPSGLPDDYWSLGATIAFVATGCDPYFPADVGHTWSDPARLESWVARHLADGLMEPPVAAAILGCMAARPDERLTPNDVIGLLKGKRRPPGRRARPAAGSAPRPNPAAVAAGAVDWLLRTVGTGTAGHLWPAGPTGLPLDPANVQSGASGVGLFLTQAAPALGELDGRPGRIDPGRIDTRRIDTVLAATAAWVSDRLARGPQRPPGLYFGTAGMAWFLTEAAAVLGRDDLTRRADDLALGLPVHVPNPDLSHGTAGVGLAQLHQWARTGDDRFLDRAVLAAEHLGRTARRAASEPITWTVPDSAPSRLAGTTSYGFAHGTAGIATFLLYAGAAAAEPAFTALGTAALASLLPLAEEVDGAAYWPVGPDNDELWPHWCNGSSGVGTALLRAHLATGDDVFRTAAEAAARAGFRERWRHSAVQCHGLAGDSELTLDLATLGGSAGSRERHQARVEEQADALWLLRRLDSGARVPGEPAPAVFADDTGAGVSAGFGTGLAGVGSFFLRLATGAARPLLLDELLGAGPADG